MIGTLLETGGLSIADVSYLAELVPESLAQCQSLFFLLVRQKDMTGMNVDSNTQIEEINYPFSYFR